jgi:hypothetical protein
MPQTGQTTGGGGARRAATDHADFRRLRTHPK